MASHVDFPTTEFDSITGPWWDERVLKRNSPASALILASGPRDAEAKLLERLEDLIPRSPEVLGAPIRIVVPSRSLRRHVLKVLAEHFGAVVGVVVQTHMALALDVLERAAVELPAGGARVQNLLARRFAANEDVLQRELSGFDDGYAPVVAAVRDLLDAGFGSEKVDALGERIMASVRGAEAERAVAVVRVAAQCHATAERTGFGHRGTLHETAAGVLAERGEAVLPSCAILIYGFAEATGLLSDFLEALIRRGHAQIVMDHPVDPAQPRRRDPGFVFTERLRDHIIGPGAGKDEIERDGADSRCEISAFNAPGPEAEVREVAGRVRHLLQSGVAAEKIGVVFRGLNSATVVAVRRHFRRLGIPFSGEGAQAPGGASARRASALLDILMLGPDARTQSWLSAASWGDSLSNRELDLAMRSLGAARLSQVAALEVDAFVGPAGLRLPVVEKMEMANGETRKKRRFMEKGNLAAGVGRALALVKLLEQRPIRAPLGTLFVWIHQVIDLLGSETTGEYDDVLTGALDRLEGELPEELETRWAEFSPLLASALEGLGAEPVGGRGGGVQVLTVMEARGRTFEQLFLPSLNRGIFPAQMADDPVFSTTARRAVSQLLPDLPLKERSRPEERYLFAQLMASAPAVTLSYQRVNSDGKEMNPSVFMERLHLEGYLSWTREGAASETSSERHTLVESGPDLFEGRPDGLVRPSLESAVIEGIKGRSPGFFSAINRLMGSQATHLEAILEELDPPAPRQDLGPFLGIVGLRLPKTVWVSFLNALVACPWKAFLEKELGIEAPPEAAFSEEGLVGALIGSVVHEVLERVVVDRGVASNVTLDEARRHPAVKVPRPSISDLKKLAAEVARHKAVEEGMAALGPAVAAFALQFLRRARDLAWPTGEAHVIGVETLGQAEIRWLPAEAEHEIGTLVHFRADRVDRPAGGEHLLLLDYKTGMPATGSARFAIGRGKLLQGVAYALGGGEGAVGQYVVLKDIKKPLIDIDEELASGVIEPARAIFGSWAEGVFFPRLSSPDGQGKGPSCGWCPLKSACLYGDSGVGRRMAAAFGAMNEDAPLRLMWELPKNKVAKAKPTKAEAKA
ncbi:MAG: PD-(D/E)XK nuclease family protein [Thermoanaerobaculales bacterium]|nr:PD-(D/E)XK nuclease family protein [Thermoanaerobaculales bacterium]